jgi:hypothetical protein
MSRIAGVRKWSPPHDIKLSETLMETVKAAQVTCTIYNPVTDTVLETLKALDVREYHLQPSRAVVLKRRTGFLGIGAGIVLEEEPADKILFYVALADAKAAVQALAAACSLNIPGHGSAVYEEVEIGLGSAWEEHPLTPVPGTESVLTEENLASLTCTVQRGRGDRIVKSVLGLGVPMPHVTTGEGTGLREKLGLIRVTIPSGKDVVHAVASEHEATEILGSLVDTARLDRFGSGFIYESPIAGGVVNNMVIRGQRHSASIEQLIGAVDKLMGSTDWRKRSLGGDDPTKRHKYLHELVSLNLICNEGRAGDLVRAALAAGAGGATISKARHAHMNGAVTPISAAREMTDLIIGKDMVDDIAASLEAAGVFDEEAAGFIAVKPVAVACTHPFVDR